MAAICCPRCQEPYVGPVTSSDWLTCRSCRHRWMPVTASGHGGATAGATSSDPAAAISDLPVVAAGSQGPVDQNDDDEYAPIETDEKKVAALTNRHAAPASDFGNISSAKAVASGTDPFDPGLFDKMARNDKAERRSQPPQPAQPSPPQQPAKPAAAASASSNQIACPVCGHGYMSDIADDQQQRCPQCGTNFTIGNGEVSSNGARITGGDVLLGRVLRGCLIDRKVGEGGMGAVYHARQLSLDRSIAIKVLPPELARNKNFITRFEREAKSLAKINHPNILHIYDFGEDPELGVYFMIIEFVQGRDLGDILHENYTLGQVEVLDIIRQALLGLEQASEKGVIHRDIKPDNLMLTDEGVCKVSDFGLAKANSAERDVTTIGVRVGTPAFMSPEQCDGDDVDYRSDVYNLGCTAFLALTGQLPYDADTPFAIMLKHKNDPVPTPRMHNPNLDSRVERLVMQMIAKRPSERCTSLHSLIETIEDLEVQLSGTATILRKSRGPIRPASEVESVEHARLTSTGIKKTHQPRTVAPLPLKAPNASAGEEAVPSWLKPVDQPPKRETTGNLNPIPTPRPVPPPGSTSQPGLKNLRSKLAEAKNNNIKGEVENLRQEGDRLAAAGQNEQAAAVWMRAAAMTPNSSESQELIRKATRLRRGSGWGRLFKRLIILVIVLAGLAAGTFYGVPVTHNLLAEQSYQSIQSITVPANRLEAYRQFISKWGTPWPWYAQVFKQDYEIISVVRAKKEMQALQTSLAPKPINTPKPPDPGEKEMEQLTALRDDQSVPWTKVVAAARHVVEHGEAKERARPILTEAEQQVAAMASDFEAIRKAWAAGKQGEVAQLSKAFREKHTRAGAAAPVGLPGRLVITDAGTNLALKDARIVTKAVPVDDEQRAGIIAGEAELAPGESVFVRYPHTTVQLSVSAEGYRTELVTVTPNPSEDELTFAVEMVPAVAWEQTITKAPTWLHTTLVPSSKALFVRTPDVMALVNLERGAVVNTQSREQIPVPTKLPSDKPQWTDAWDQQDSYWVTGTTDGIAVPVRVSDTELTLGTIFHRGPQAVVAFKRKELTFQPGVLANFVISTGSDGFELHAATKTKNLWTAKGLVGFRRPHLSFLDDKVVVIDERQAQMFDEAEGRLISSMPLPSPRIGNIYKLPKLGRYLMATEQGAIMINVSSTGFALQQDTVLNAAGGRILSFHDNKLISVGADRSLSSLMLNNGAWQQHWRVVLPPAAKVVTTVSGAGEAVTVVDDQGRIYVFNAQDGKQLRRVQHNAIVLGEPLVLDGKLIVADRNGKITAYLLPGFAPAP